MESPDHELQLGCITNSESTQFRLFFPGAELVECLIFKSFDEKNPISLGMKSDDGIIWHLIVGENLIGHWYQYKVQYKIGMKPDTPHADKPFADPYSTHVTVINTYRQEAKSFIFNDSYDWEDDTYVKIDDPRDLIIYEAHIKDLVGHESSQASGDGIYNKWLDYNQKGGIPHLKKLGVNAVEFLPLHKFPMPEPPYGVKTSEGFKNSWNKYSTNYWGYMTSFFLAPETVYASGSDDNGNDIIGLTPVAVTELKNLIKELHKNDIAVIMDVVYNHTSLVDINPLCHHLPDIFLRKDARGKYMNRSGTGNEIQSENPFVEKLITDSIKYWIEQYHIDGFRFDLAGLLNENCWDKIRETAKSVNPDAVLIAEPWGGRYVPYLFSNHDWSSWNDRFRNGIKGSDPVHDRGFIFADWLNGASRQELENWFQGTLRVFEGGLFNTSAHAVNYLESHDGYTLGDFIRISTRYEGVNPVVVDKKDHITLYPEEKKIAKLGAFCLMVTPGITMIHAGQEFARSKIITDDNVGDPEAGRMDYNSYNKDNKTNWINFEDLSVNNDLFNFYIGLINIRRESPALRKSDHEFINFDHYSDPLHLCFYVNGSSADDIYDYYVAINATRFHKMDVFVPAGTWEVLVKDGFASLTPIDIHSGASSLPSSSAMLLRKLRH